MSYYASLTGSQLETLTGVRQEVFNFCLDLLEDYQPKDSYKEDHLLAFLIKLKQSMSFEVLGIMLKVNGSLLKSSFIEILEILSVRTKSMIFWPSKEAVKATMAPCFKENFPECRCLIGFTKIPCQKPKHTFQKKLLYSAGKSRYTVKVMLGMAPNGMISYLSKAYGGSASDGHIATHSGFLELPTSGDVVIANRGFPEIQTAGVVIVKPSRSSSNSKFSESEIEETRIIDIVRVHIKRLTGKLKQWQILKKELEAHFLPHINELLHICAVMVNLSSPILKQQPENTAEDDEEGKEDLSDGSETDSAVSEEEEEENDEAVIQTDGHFLIDDLFFNQIVNCNTFNAGDRTD